LRQYERCSVALDEELGVKPDKSTLALYQQIRDDHIDDLTIVRANPPHTSESNALPVQELLGSLNHVSELLAQVQNAAQHGMQAIELVMNDSRHSKMTHTKSPIEFDVS
jgi:DNA-binding SARP family transcriptional activator